MESLMSLRTLVPVAALSLTGAVYALTHSGVPPASVALSLETVSTEQVASVSGSVRNDVVFGAVDTWVPEAEMFSSGQTWHPDLIAHIREIPYGLIRFVDWTGNGGQYPGDGPGGRWDERVLHGELREGVILSYETMIDLCNAARTDCWFTVPARSDEDPLYASSLAELVKDRLDPSLKVYIEWSNETWNLNGPFGAQYASKRGQALGLSTDEVEAGHMYQSCAASHLWAGFESVFGKDNARVVKVLAGEAADPELTALHYTALRNPTCNPSGTMPDAYAIAPYLWGNSVGDLRANLPALERMVRAQRERVAGEGDALIAYEAGQHVMENADTVNRDPGMYDLYLDYLSMLEEYMSVIVHNDISSRWGSGGAWGLVDGDFNEQSHKRRAVEEWLRR